MAYYAEPTLLLQKPDGFHGWESFLRLDYSFHTSGLYAFFVWPVGHLTTILPLGLFYFSFINLRINPLKPKQKLDWVTFGIVCVTLSLFGVMSRAMPPIYKIQLLPFKVCEEKYVYVSPWYASLVTGILALLIIPLTIATVEVLKGNKKT